MAVKIENNSSVKLPKWTEGELNKMMEFLPREHLFGIEKLRLVDFINDPRLKNANIPQKMELPGLYYPKAGGQAARMEIAVGVLLRPTESFTNRLMPRLSFKANLASVLFSLVGQHYYLTFRHSTKRSQIETQVRQYAEKHLREWSEKQSANSVRAKIFKPFRPLLERWARALGKRAAAQRKQALR